MSPLEKCFLGNVICDLDLLTHDLETLWVSYGPGKCDKIH